MNTVRVQYRHMTDAEVVEYQLISFLQRAGLHPLDEAQAYARLRKQDKLDAAAIAKKVGKTTRYVAERLQLTTLITPVKDALAGGKISLDHALLIAKLQPDTQSKALKYCLNSYNYVTIKDLREWIGDEVHLDLESAPFPTGDKDLLPKAGPCSTCPKRAGNNPDLFSDVKKNICTDRSCFNAKVKAWTEREIEELKAQGKEILKLSTSYYDAPKGALKESEYTVVDSAKAGAFGIFVNGPNKGMLTGIRLKGEKAVASSSAGAPARKLDPEEIKARYKRRVEIFETRIEQEARNRLFKAILARTKWPLSRKEFELIAIEVFDRQGERLRQEAIDLVAQATGIKMPKEHWDYYDKMTKLIPKLTDQQLAQLGLAIVLNNEMIFDPTFNAGEDDRFKVLLSIHPGIDRKAVTSAVAKELEPKRPKPPKIEKAKAKKGARTS